MVDTYAVILGMAIATYATRALAVFLLSRRLPSGIERFLSHIPAAVFAALVAPPLLAPQGKFAPGLSAVAAVPAAIVAWRTRQVLPTILSGMGSYWALRWVVG
jgi:branched-subunit amino acid transport protein